MNAELVRLGLEYEVGNGGSRLSYSQRQRLAIARAIMKNPDILVFNEPTSGLDPATETRVLNAVLEWAQGPHGGLGARARRSRAGVRPRAGLRRRPSRRAGHVRGTRAARDAPVAACSPDAAHAVAHAAFRLRPAAGRVPAWAWRYSAVASRASRSPVSGHGGGVRGVAERLSPVAEAASCRRHAAARGRRVSGRPAGARAVRCPRPPDRHRGPGAGRRPRRSSRRPDTIRSASSIRSIVVIRNLVLEGNNLPVDGVKAEGHRRCGARHHAGESRHPRPRQQSADRRHLDQVPGVELGDPRRSRSSAPARGCTSAIRTAARRSSPG